jgi:hypothetical protein
MVLACLRSLRDARNWIWNPKRQLFYGFVMFVEPVSALPYDLVKFVQISIHLSMFEWILLF